MGEGIKWGPFWEGIYIKELEKVMLTLEWVENFQSQVMETKFSSLSSVLYVIILISHRVAIWHFKRNLSQGFFWQMKNDILRIKQVKNMSKCLKFCKMQIGTQTKALDERNWFASRVFLANEKWDFDNQISQKHVKMPQILQNTNRYSNESSRQKELICLKGFSGKRKMRFWQPI